MSFGIDADNVFGFWDWVGGRYSVCSAVGVLPLSLQYGYQVMESFLAGAHDMDTHFYEAPLRNNLPVLMGLLGVWNSSFLGHPAKAILPCESFTMPQCVDVYLTLAFLRCAGTDSLCGSHTAGGHGVERKEGLDRRLATGV